MISDQLLASAAKITAGPGSATTVGIQPLGSSSTPVGLGQLSIDGFNGGGGASGNGGAEGATGGRGEGAPGKGKKAGDPGHGATSRPLAESNNTSGRGVTPFTGRAAGGDYFDYHGLFIVLGIAAVGWWI